MTRQINKPCPGFFKTRAVRGGPWLPARIRRICACTIGGSVEHDHTPECDRSGNLVADIDGKEVALERIWLGREISLDEYHRLCGNELTPLSDQEPAF